MRKNESAHSLKVDMCSCEKGIEITSGHCSCAVGLSGSCGHVVVLLFMIADFCAKNLKYIPSDISCTSVRQTWHEPRGKKITAKPVQELSFVAGGSPSSTGRKIEPTLYDP